MRKTYVLSHQDLYGGIKTDFILQNIALSNSGNQKDENAQSNLHKDQINEFLVAQNKQSPKIIQNNIYFKEHRIVLVEKDDNKLHPHENLVNKNRKITKNPSIIKSGQVPLKKAQVQISFRSSIKNTNNNAQIQNSISKLNREDKAQKQNASQERRPYQRRSSERRVKINESTLVKRNNHSISKIRKQIIPQGNLSKTNELICKNEKIQNCVLSKRKVSHQDLETLQQQHSGVQKGVKFQYPIDFKQLQRQIAGLQNELIYKQACFIMLEKRSSEQQLRLEQKNTEIFDLYKQNQHLSHMLRDLEALMNNQQKDYQDAIHAIQSELTDKQTIIDEVQQEKQMIYRNNIKYIMEIQEKSKELIQSKLTQIQKNKKIIFLQSQYQQITSAYEKIKNELTEIIKIQQNQRMLGQLISKSEDQTARNSLITSRYDRNGVSIINENENMTNELAFYHMNQKFKAHVKTYEQEITYWKDEINFMKTNHQHEIQNIRTILQCSFQKTILDKQQKLNDLIRQLRYKINIQQELISNYEGVCKRQERLEKYTRSKINQVRDFNINNAQAQKALQFQKNQEQTELQSLKIFIRKNTVSDKNSQQKNPNREGQIENLQQNKKDKATIQQNGFFIIAQSKIDYLQNNQLQFNNSKISLIKQKQAILN